MGNARQQLANLFRDIESQYWESTFLAFILSYTLLLVLTAFGYSPDARLFPLLIGVPLIVLILFRVGVLLSDRIDVRSASMFGSMTGELTEADEDPSTEYDALSRYRQQVEIVVWLFGFTALFWAFGIQISLVVFVFAFVAIYEGSLMQALGATSVAYGLVYVLFIQILSISPYEPALLSNSVIELLPGFAWVLI